MNFYQDIIDRLYVWNTTKGDTNFADPYAFIEAKHFESNDKDFIFYERLLHEMPNHFDPMMRSDLLKEIILYCNRKIDSYKSDYEQPDFIYSITGEPLFFEIKNDKVGQALKSNEKCRKEHALDILNYAIVSIEGEVEHPDQNFYDNKFIKAINSTPNKAEEIRYINHHYSRAKKKNVFLRKIDNLFDRTRKYPSDEVLTQDARSILLEWYNSEIEKYPQLVIEQVDLLKYRNMKIEVKHDIETFELEKCIYLMGFWINDDSKVISEFLDKESDIDEKYVTPFVKELNMNLLRKDTHEAKRDLIKYYIFQFIEIQGFLDIHKSIIQHKPDSEGESRQRNTSEVKTDFEKYVILCSQYFDIFFNVIQLCCNNYNIDFFKACLDLNFPLDFIDSGNSLSFNENNTSPSQQNYTPPPSETHTEKYLCEFEDAFNSKEDYLKAIEIINSYFKVNEYEIAEQIFVKNGYTKRLAFALGEIWRSEKNGTIPFEYLSIYKQLFSIFSKHRLEKEHVFSSPLYKYSISKT